MKKGNNGKLISTICLVIVVFVYILVQFWGSSEEEIHDQNVEQQVANSESDEVKNDVQLDETQESDYNLSTNITDSDTQYAQVSSEEYEPVYYYFRNDKLLEEHYEKHGIEMGFDSWDAYVDAANAVIQNPDSLHKIEAEDGDDIYYLEASNEFVVVSTDEYIRTYFCPDKGIDYYNRQ